MAALVGIRHDPMGQLMCNIDHTDNCEQAAEAATILERERIIKLLEPIRNADIERPYEYYEDPFGLVIALIKGEEND
jgi:hypothetical protein